MEIKDPYTQKFFLPTRSNQKFENKKTRQKFHNDIAKKLRQSLAGYNRPLFINHKVLSELMVNVNDAVFSKEYLRGKGIHFGIHTHSKIYEGKTHAAIYGYILIKEDVDKIRVIKL